MKHLGISGAALKWVAIITMLCDHLSFGILLPYWGIFTSLYDFQAIQSYPESMRWQVYLAFGLRFIGRIAFPIFCFLLAEGVHYTHNRRRYAIRLLIFALISEIPFDMGLFHVWSYPMAQNVFFTLLLGFLVCCAIDWFDAKLAFGSSWTSKVADVVAFLVGCFLAEHFHTDYGATGVALIVLMYLCRERRVFQYLAILAALFYEYTAILAIPFLALYNGTRGRQNKWLFYVFYPAHLLIIGLVFRYLTHTL